MRSVRRMFLLIALMVAAVSVTAGTESTAHAWGFNGGFQINAGVGYGGGYGGGCAYPCWSGMPIHYAQAYYRLQVAWVPQVRYVPQLVYRPVYTHVVPGYYGFHRSAYPCYRSYWVYNTYGERVSNCEQECVYKVSKYRVKRSFRGKGKLSRRSIPMLATPLANDKSYNYCGNLPSGTRTVNVRLIEKSESIDEHDGIAREYARVVVDRSMARRINSRSRPHRECNSDVVYIEAKYLEEL